MQLVASGVTVRMPCQQAYYDDGVADLRRVMGDEAFEQAHARGLAMTLEQAIAFALEEDAGTPEARTMSSHVMPAQAGIHMPTTAPFATSHPTPTARNSP